MNRLETRELEYFAAVSGELHFGRAAENLGISQPVLSRAISRLERRLGVLLLNRTSRKVELTEAGATFREECLGLLRRMEVAVARTRRSADVPRLVIAVRPGMGSGPLSQILRRYAGPLPELLFTHDQPGAVRDGAADAALLCVDSDDLAGLECVVVGQEESVVLLPRDNALTGRVSVTVTDLEREAGYRSHCPEVGLDEIIDRVALGRLVTVVGSGAADRLPSGVVAVPVSDLPPTTLALCWAQDAGDPALSTLVESLSAAAVAPRPAFA
ncbi:LysR family transcriptional regulator [Streptomyces liangshanensis]|uniref:LysR family transcriptional regulator n=1 Tax=Streptomyces liangshanensis TaxID=2717324 RepID=UPI0036DF4C78